MPTNDPINNPISGPITLTPFLTEHLHLVRERSLQREGHLPAFSLPFLKLSYTRRLVIR